MSRPLGTGVPVWGTALRSTAPQTPLPMMRPNPPKLSQYAQELAEIEALGTYSNYGPVNSRFERELIARMFGSGECLTVCNATIGLMLAIREVIGEDRSAKRKYALMPSFTFAATAHAALWCGLTPLLCDIDPKTWLPDEASEEVLLRQYEGEIAVIVPYATFGNSLDLDRYQRLSEQHQIPVVVDAAASLGALDAQGRAFGTGFPWPVVFSMHATKAFSVGEGGVIYCADSERINRLRAMGAFGFEQGRSATTLGLNSKLTEIAALTALLQLEAFDEVVRHRVEIAHCYEAQLARSLTLQRRSGRRQVQAFEAVLLPRRLASSRGEIARRLQEKQIGTATYFSPHLAEQPYFQKHAVAGPLPVTEDVAARILSLPLLPGMLPEQVATVAGALHGVMDTLACTGNMHPKTTWRHSPLPAIPISGNPQHLGGTGRAESERIAI